MYDFDTWYECLNSCHTFRLAKHKPKVEKEERPKSVEVYYAIVKSRGVRYGSNAAWEKDIADTVTDIRFWQQVIKEYINPIGLNGNALAADKMLRYYREGRMPGTRERAVPEKHGLAGFTPVEQPPVA